PGRLGTLLASDTAPNGGWWVYKWYGEMSGNMVATVPPTPNDSAALDGFANVDAARGTASVLFAGVNDGKIPILLKGFDAAPFFGDKVHAVVERTPFANRSTMVKATDTISTADVSVINNQITVSLSNGNGSDGYRLKLSSTGTSGSAGADGSGGAAAAA